MPCACNKGRSATAGGGQAGPAGTYRVMAGGRKVYETTNAAAAQTVAERFADATVLAPGETA